MPTGKNKVPMAQLREVLGNAGFENVRTYIQSGNALMESGLSLKAIETQVHLKQDFSPEELVITKNASYMYIPGHMAEANFPAISSRRISAFRPLCVISIQSVS